MLAELQESDIIKKLFQICCEYDLKGECESEIYNRALPAVIRLTSRPRPFGVRPSHIFPNA